MPIRQAIVHLIDKKPDGNPAALHTRDAALEDTDALNNLLFDLNNAYNAKQGKVWGLFHGESGAYPLSGWLKKYLREEQDFVEFSKVAVEHLTKLLEESSLSVGGHVIFAHYQQGMTEYLTIALLQHSEGVSVSEDLGVSPTRHLDLSKVHLAARINLTEWQNNEKSRQYISYTKGKNGKKVSDYFSDFIGCQQGVDGAGETRTLLKAFTDFVESEDLPKESAREKAHTLVDYATTQNKLGETVSLEDLSSMIDEDRPQAFIEHIRNKDYELSTEIPADKRTINQFGRLSGRAEGLSISFESHLLGSDIEYDESNGTLLIRKIPTTLREQIKRMKD